MAGAQVAAVVLAAGAGRRMGAGGNKVFLSLGGRPILAWSVALFEASPQVGAVILVAAPTEIGACRRLVADQGFRKVSQVVAGGSARQESEWNGVDAARAEIGADGVVLVHDAVRPLAGADLLPRLIGAARTDGGAIPAVHAGTGVVAAANGMVAGYPAGLWAVQTPQAFRLAELIDAHRRASADAFMATDTAAVYEYAGGTIRIVESSPDNIKITTPDDLIRAEIIARRYLG